MRHVRAVLPLCIVYSILAQPSADQLFEQALRFQQAGKWAEAEKSYRAHLKQFGPKPEVLANLGAVLVRQERYEDAISAYSRALKLAPSILPIHLNIGLAYFKSGLLAPAVTHFTAVLEKEPGNTQARQLRAMSLLELERFEEAAKDYSALMPSQDVNVRLGLASAYTKLNRAEEAQAIMEPLFETDSADVKLVLAQVLVETGKLDEAKKALERALELNPALPTVHLNLGAIHWRQQQTDTAIEEWRKELAKHPNSFQAVYTLGTALALSADHREEAARLLRKAVTLQPRSSLALYELGKLVWQQTKGTEAADLLERSVKADPKFRKAHYLLASVYQGLGRKQDAAKEFAIVKQLSSEANRRSRDLFEATR